MAPNPLRLTLEFARTVDADDPHAFRFERQRYTLRTVGGGRELIEVPWGGAFDADLAAVRLPDRDPALVAQVGERLRAILQPAGWKAVGREILAAVDAGRRVVLTIRSNAAELNALPWALTTLSRGGPHLGALPGVLLRSAWPETQTAPPAETPRAAGGRVLFAWSAAGGRVPTAAHQAAIAAACTAGHVDFDPDRDVVPHASVDALVAALERGPPVAILHLLAHGAEAGSTYGLALDGPDGAVIADAGHLRRRLAPFASEVRLVTVAACDGGNVGALGNSLGSVGQALHRAGFASVIASRFPLSVAGSNTLTRVLYRTLLEGPVALETALLAAREALAAEPAHLDWASVQLLARAEDGDDTRPVVFRPYRGLLAFQPAHARFLFGRDAERAETLGDLAALTAADAPRFLVVAGASGTGKSSMVLAGAVPDLVRDRPGNTPSRTDLDRAADLLRGLPGDLATPMVRQARSLLDAAARLSATSAWRARIIRPGSDPQAALKPIVAQLSSGAGDLLLIVDQFEELFTQTTDPAARAAFTKALWALARAPDSGVSVIITIRVDFLGRCGELVVDETGLRLDRVAYDEAHRVFVAQMGPAQLRAAIEGPAAKVGLQLEAGLADRMLADVEGEPGALPLLSYTLDLLWQQRDGRVLTQAAYDALGGVSGALHGKADALVNGLDEAHRLQARRLLVRLVGISADGATDTRQRVTIAQLRPGRDAQAQAFDAVLALLVDARLLVRAETAGEPTVEVAHEALIRRWPRLRAWIQADHEMLVQVAEIEGWVEHWRRYETLLQTEQLGYAQRIQTKYPDDLSEAAAALISASAADQEARARRSRRRLVGIAIAAGLIAVAMGALGLWGWSSSRTATDALGRAAAGETRAKANALRARTNAATARAALIGSSAQTLAASDPAGASLLLTELARQGLTEVAPLAARGLAIDLLDAAVPQHVFSLPGPREGVHEWARVAFGPNGTLVAFTPKVGRQAATLRCWRPVGDRMRSVRCPETCDPPQAIEDLIVSDAGGRMLTLSRQADVLRVCRVGLGEESAGEVWRAASPGRASVVVSEDGSQIAINHSGSGERRVWVGARMAEGLTRLTVDGEALAVSNRGLVVVNKRRGGLIAIHGMLQGVLLADFRSWRLASIEPEARIEPDGTFSGRLTAHDGTGVTEWYAWERPLRREELATARFDGDNVAALLRDGRYHPTYAPENHLYRIDERLPVVDVYEGLTCRSVSGPFRGLICPSLAVGFDVHQAETGALGYSAHIQPAFEGRDRVVDIAAAQDGQWLATIYVDGTVAVQHGGVEVAREIHFWSADESDTGHVMLRGLHVTAGEACVLELGGSLRCWGGRGTKSTRRSNDILAFAPEIDRMVRVRDGAPELVEQSTERVIARLPKEWAGFEAYTVLGGGSAVIGRVDEANRIWDVAAGAEVTVEGGIQAVQGAPTAPRLAILDGANRAWLWTRGAPLKRLGDAVTAVATSADGGRIGVRTATGVALFDGHGTLRETITVDKSQGELLPWISARGPAVLTAHPERIEGMFDKEPDTDETYSVHDARERIRPVGNPSAFLTRGQEIEPLKGREFLPVTASTGAEAIVYADREAQRYVVRVARADADQTSTVLSVHGEAPDSLHFAADRLFIGFEGHMEIWEPFLGLKLATLRAECLGAIVSNATGDVILTGGGTCPLRVWDLRFEAVLARLGQRTEACMSAAFRQRWLGEDAETAATETLACAREQQRAPAP